MVKQTDAFQGSGIAVDIFRKFFEFLEGGQGVQAHIVTNGFGANQAILSDVDRIVPVPVSHLVTPICRLQYQRLSGHLSLFCVLRDCTNSMSGHLRVALQL